jgi:hypothetical protein
MRPLKRAALSGARRGAGSAREPGVCPGLPLGGKRARDQGRRHRPWRTAQHLNVEARLFPEGDTTEPEPRSPSTSPSSGQYLSSSSFNYVLVSISSTCIRAIYTMPDSSGAPEHGDPRTKLPPFRVAKGNIIRLNAEDSLSSYCLQLVRVSFGWSRRSAGSSTSPTASKGCPTFQDVGLIRSLVRSEGPGASGMAVKAEPFDGLRDLAARSSATTRPPIGRRDSIAAVGQRRRGRLRDRCTTSWRRWPCPRSGPV